MSMEYIRNTYKVPAKKGGRIKYTGSPALGAQFGTIVGAENGHVLVRMDGKKNTLPYHPTWEMEYLPDPVKEPASC